ncbi:MAG: imidazoleglycerol-phosphate dehydratase HisB [Deltaproteobacteria bacterium]|nr:imidazoleglycerol-phosphate dehydratase HisB [Deltaproteobacteria bacterium]
MNRITKFERKTHETEISGKLNLDGTGKVAVKTGIGFLDHMLELFCFHSGIDLELKVKGDLEVCGHHSIEDIALSLGEAFLIAMGDKRGILRYGCCYLPMDECLTRTVVDLSGRPYHVFKGSFESTLVGAFPTEMVRHFFYSFCMTAKITLHQEILYGHNDHHKIESLFKGLAKAIESAGQVMDDQLRSTKGVL